MARLLRTLGIALGLPGAAYYGKVGYDVHLASQEADRIDSQREAESTAATHAQSKLEREIAHLASLEEKLERLDKASHFDLNKWDVQISEAKARLDRLVKDREVAAQQSAQLLEDMDDARGRRTSLEAQKAKHEENLKLCADALAEARKMAEETKKMYNPMNQPLVKSLLSQVQ